MQFIRYIQRRGEEDVFSYVPKDEHASVSRFGSLTGLAGLPAQRHLEATPYVTGRGEYTHPGFGDPFRDGSDYFTTGGADVRVGVGGNLALDATINPDFGQVEVDPAIVNLTDNETFFDEKRPFFLEGSSLFSFAQVNAYNTAGFPGVFNSRRIGRSPQRDLADDAPAFYDEPSVTRIPGALKLTGKSSSGWSVAMLDAVTREEHGQFVDDVGDRHRVPIEPLSNYFVGRVRRESGDGNNAIGGLFTAVDRRLDDPTLEGMLRSSAYLAGADLNHYWANQGWAFDAFVTGSLVRGDPGRDHTDATLVGAILPAPRRRALLAGHDADFVGRLQRRALVDEALGPLARQPHATGQEPGVRDQRRGLRSVHESSCSSHRHRLRHLPTGSRVS